MRNLNLCLFCCKKSNLWGWGMSLTVSLIPGTERLLRLRASSLGSEPGTDRSISERLWSGTLRMDHKGGEKGNSFKRDNFKKRNRNRQGETLKVKVWLCPEWLSVLVSDISLCGHIDTTWSEMFQAVPLDFKDVRSEDCDGQTESNRFIHWGHGMSEGWATLTL